MQLYGNFQFSILNNKQFFFGRVPLIPLVNTTQTPQGTSNMSGPSNTTIFPIYAYFLRKSLLFDRKSNFDVNGLVINYFWNILIHFPPPPFLHHCSFYSNTMTDSQAGTDMHAHSATRSSIPPKHSSTLTNLLTICSLFKGELRQLADRHLTDTTFGRLDKSPSWQKHSATHSTIPPENCLSAKFLSAKCFFGQVSVGQLSVGQMPCRPNVVSAKCRVGDISCRPNVRRPNICRPNVVLAKCLVGQMSCRPNVVLAKCHVGQMSCRPNVVLAKCHVGQMSCRRNFMSAKCLSAKCRVGQSSCRPNVVSVKFYVGQMSVGQLS